MADIPGLPVKGYNPVQPEARIALADKAKELEERYIRLKQDVLTYFDQVHDDGGRPWQDQWFEEGLKYIQIGSSLIVRSIFAPGRVRLPEDSDGA